MNDVLTLYPPLWGAYPTDVTAPLPSQQRGSSDGQYLPVDKPLSKPKGDTPPPPPPPKGA